MQGRWQDQEQQYQRGRNAAWLLAILACSPTQHWKQTWCKYKALSSKETCTELEENQRRHHMEQAESEGNREKWNDYHGCPSWNHSCGPWSGPICGKFLSLHRLAQNLNGRKVIHSSFLHLQGLVFVMGHSSCPSPTHISLANSRSMSPTAEACTSGPGLHQQCHSAECEDLKWSQTQLWSSKPTLLD